jgi:hypothetical protein
MGMFYDRHIIRLSVGNFGEVQTINIHVDILFKSSIFNRIIVRMK